MPTDKASPDSGAAELRDPNRRGPEAETAGVAPVAGDDLIGPPVPDLEDTSPVPPTFLRSPHRYPEETLALVLLVGVAVTILTGIFFRYIVSDPQAWTEPLARYLLVWLTLIGAAVAVKHDLHMAVELPTGRIPHSVLRIVRIGARLLQVVLFGYFIWFGLELAAANTTATTVPGIDRNHVLLAVPVSGVLMLLHSLRHLVADLRRG